MATFLVWDRRAGWHLEGRRFSPATVRAYAFDIVCLARFLKERGIGLGDLVPTDVG